MDILHHYNLRGLSRSTSTSRLIDQVSGLLCGQYFTGKPGLSPIFQAKNHGSLQEKNGLQFPIAYRFDFPIHQSPPPQCPLNGVHDPCSAVSKGAATHCTEVHLCETLEEKKYRNNLQKNNVHIHDS